MPVKRTPPLQLQFYKGAASPLRKPGNALQPPLIQDLMQFGSCPMKAVAPVAELVDASTWNVDACGHTGSNPVGRTLRLSKGKDMKKRDRDMLDKLREERARLIRQAEALQNELRGLDRAITLIEAEAGETQPKPKNVKTIVQKIVEDAGLVGVTVDEVLGIARARGLHLERATVASNLSRGKTAGTYDARDGRYFFRLNPKQGPGDAYALRVVN